MRRFGWLLLALAVASPARAQGFHLFSTKLRIYAAASLSGPLQELIAASGLDPGDVAAPVFGQSGTLRAQIEAGAPAGLFVSADLDQPRTLETRPGALPAVAFAGNRLCVFASRSVGLTTANLLDRLLDPHLRLATAAPGDAAVGDDAFAMFSRADSLQPGAGATLSAKAQRLLGAPGAGDHSPAASIFLQHQADALVDFCSIADQLRSEAPDVVATTLPGKLSISAVYGLVVLRPTRAAMRLALFMLSAKGQSILADAGLLPLGVTPP